MTELERYLLQNRDAFDTLEAPTDPANNWKNIEKVIRDDGEGLSPIMNRNWHSRLKDWAVAASIGLLIGLGFAFKGWLGHNTDSAPPAITEYFPDLINHDEDALNRFVVSNDVEIGFKNLNNDYDEYIDELSVIDQLREEYLKEVAGIPDNEQLIKTLIRFYERKIKILERLNREIEKEKNDEERVFSNQRM